MEQILDQLLNKPGNEVVRLTKFWVFALEHRPVYSREAGRKLSPLELKERASIPWESLSAEERMKYHLKAKALNREVKRRGFRFKNKSRKKRRLTDPQYHVKCNEEEYDLNNDVDFYQCLLDTYTEDDQEEE
jgi:hypothetical protein